MPARDRDRRNERSCLCGLERDHDVRGWTPGFEPDHWMRSRRPGFGIRGGEEHGRTRAGPAMSAGMPAREVPRHPSGRDDLADGGERPSRLGRTAGPARRSRSRPGRSVPASSPLPDLHALRLGPAAHLIAALEVAQALRWLVTREPPEPPVMVSADVRDLRFQHVELPPRDPQCPCCGERRFEFLAGGPAPAEALCGRDSVLVRPSSGATPDFAAIAARLGRAHAEGGAGELLANEFVLRFRKPPHELTLFTDGRAIVKGTDDPALARSLVARYFGA